MSGMTVVCAVDGGETKTLAIVLGADGRELARASAGPSNYVAGDGDRVVANVTLAVGSAVRETNATLPIASLWVGLSGIDRPGAREEISGRLAHLAAGVRLTDDAQLLVGALPDECGVVLIAGTDSIAFGADRHGATARAGGWDYLIGDEGSGYALGRNAISAAARAADGRGPQTSLLPALLGHWELERPLQIIDRVYGEPAKTIIAGCARLVFDAANAHDPVAIRILSEGANELAMMVTAVSESLDLGDDGLSLVLAGNLLVEQERYRTTVQERLWEEIDLDLVEIVAEPALVAAQSLARNRTQ